MLHCIKYIETKSDVETKYLHPGEKWPQAIRSLGKVGKEPELRLRQVVVPTAPGKSFCSKAVPNFS